MSGPRWSIGHTPVDPRVGEALAFDTSFRGNLRALAKGQTMLVASPTPERMWKLKRRYAKELAECKGTVQLVVPDGVPGQLGSN